MHFVLVLSLILNGHVVVQSKSPPLPTLAACEALGDAAQANYAGSGFDRVETFCIWQP